MTPLLTRLARTARFQRPTRGDRPLVIDRLISPLRYDVIVRQQYLEFVSDHLDLFDHNFPEFVERSRLHPYGAWFGAVGRHRICPGARGFDLEAAFRGRLVKTTRLFLSVQRDGFDPTHPITLRSAGLVASTATGKRLAGRLYPSDGCHRLAMLRFLGRRTLAPAWYEVLTDSTWSPPDNTRVLVEALRLPAPDYFRFLSMGYGDREFASELTLMESLRHEPGAVAEVRRIIDADRAVLAR